MGVNLTIEQRALLRISQATKELHDSWKDGAYLRDALGVPLPEARRRAVKDRLDLAARFLAGANAAFRGGRYRDAVSRGYYAAYHALRAATFHESGGDDFEQHSTLPKNLPDGLSDPAGTRNGLTAARLARNRADYDPYPKTESPWRSDAEETIAFARTAVRDVREYVANA